MQAGYRPQAGDAERHELAASQPAGAPRALHTRALSAAISACSRPARSDSRSHWAWGLQVRALQRRGRKGQAKRGRWRASAHTRGEAAAAAAAAAQQGRASGVAPGSHPALDRHLAGHQHGRAEHAADEACRGREARMECREPRRLSV